MSLFNNAIIGASSQGGYKISRSVRFRSSASAYFNRTLTTPTNNLKWTWSAWIKRGTLSVANVPFGAGDGTSNNFGSLQFTTSDTLQFAQINGGVYNVQMVTSAVFRDPSAWYHIVIVYDSANATSTDRVQIYVNGVRQSVTYSTGPFAQNTASKINSAIAHYIGKLDYTTVYFDGYQTEVNFIDGQALTPSSFGETNALTGVWQPKKYGGTYGNNGFYLNFSDNSGADALGYDSSSGSYSRNLRTSGTNIGTFTVNGGLAAAFDGNYNQPNATSARATTPAAGYNTAVIGKDWGSGVTKTITAVQLFAQNDGGFVGGTTTALVFKLQGSNDGSNWTDLTSAITGPATGAGTVITVTSGITTTTAYRYHRINVNADGSNNYYMCELAFYEAGAYGLNNWYPNNISVTAGATYDSMIDVPTLYADGGGNGRGNYATLNPIGTPFANGTVTDGNLKFAGLTTTDKGVAATISISSGTFYWESTQLSNSGGSNCYAGVILTGASSDVNANRVYVRGDGIVTKYGTSLGIVFPTFTNNDVIGCAFDRANNTLALYKNGTLGYTVTGLNNADHTPWVGGYTTTDTWAINFGQRPFSYTPPTGFKALNTQNLPDAPVKKGNQHFDVVTSTATVSTGTTVSSLAFSPGLMWRKNRNNVESHYWVDAVRGTGAGGFLVGNSTAAATGYPNSDGTLTFDSNGYTITETNWNAGEFYFNSRTYVDWIWNAGSSTVTNTSGTISAQVRANATAGFSVVTYTGTNASGNQSVGHGLGVAPSMIIAKSRTTANGWVIYHSSLGSNAYIFFDTAASGTLANYWGTGITSTAFGVYTGGAGGNNINAANMVAYCFAAVSGYSAFGSYTGNGSTDGPFVFTGFRPRFIVLKRTDVANAWMMYDTARNTANVVNNYLFANGADAEQSGSGSTDLVDFLSNGFKVRCSNLAENASGGTYIYMAFAENPFKISLAR